MSINVSSDRQNRTVHRAQVDEKELHRLVLHAVAGQLGLVPDAANLTVRVYSTAYQEGSLGTSKPRIEVEIIEAHGAESQT